MGQFIDLSARRFGRWLVLKRIGARHWLCRCDCGIEKLVRRDHLLRGLSLSCGCMRREQLQGNTRGIGNARRHGMANTTVEYRAWRNIKTRCLNSQASNYSYYGGRGITVCPGWIDSFEAFFDAVGPRPGPGYSIDRIDVNGNYEPGNVRWATAKEQRANRRERLVN